MATIQRPQRGSRISSFYPVKSLPSLSSLDSAFQLQEYISLVIRLDVHDVDTIVSVPGKAKEQEHSPENDGKGDGKGDEKDSDRDRKSEIAVDEACWIYEQLRRLAQDLSHPLITMLQQECTRASCPEMKAGEWLYLCVAHGNDGAMEQCCAIDYILHTLDSATALLNSPRAFPSRLSIPQTSHRHFSSLARRLGRIFAHAYFHHREAFEQAEAESSLYARFLALTSKFDLVPSEFLVIPPRLTLSEGRTDIDVQPPRLLAAAIGPRGERSQSSPRGLGGSVGPLWERGSGNVSGNERAKSASPPGLGGDSPRKVGRNRTYTMVFSEAYSAAEELSKGDRREELEGSLAKEDEAGRGGLPSSAADARESIDDESAPTPTGGSDEMSAQQPSPATSKVEDEPSSAPESVTLESAFDIESPVDATPSSLVGNLKEATPGDPATVDFLSEIIIQPEASVLAAPEAPTASKHPDSEAILSSKQTVDPEQPVPEVELEPEPVLEPTTGGGCVQSDDDDLPSETQKYVVEPATTDEPQTPASVAIKIASRIEPEQVPTAESCGTRTDEHALISMPETDAAAGAVAVEEPAAHLEKPVETDVEKEKNVAETASPSAIPEGLDVTPVEPTIAAAGPVPPEPETPAGPDSLLPQPEAAAPAPATEDHAQPPGSSGPPAVGDA